jgi:BlaI family penicillinase repressor
MELTKAEERVMQVLWKMEKGFIKDILEDFDDPKPAYTTVATVIKILQKKGYVSYKEYGKAHQFYPVVSKASYSKKYVNPVFKRYFRSSLRDVVSFFTENNKVHPGDLDDAIKVLKNLKKKKK